MKKNVMMRVASALLVAVLMTTCAISGTFAKYTTSATGSDSARVAKWGVVITANGQMFTTTENKTVAGFTGNTVLSAKPTGNDKENVVAPGMEGKLMEMTITGTPEVAVEVKYEATLTLSDWKVDDAEYCPIEFTVGETTFKLGDSGIVTISDLKSKVEAAINAYTANYAAGIDLSATATVKTPVVSWKWAFTGNDDTKDTQLGNAATGATIALTVVTTVTQLD